MIAVRWNVGPVLLTRKPQKRVIADTCWQMQVKDFARVSDSIIGWGSSVGRWARIDNKSVIGEDVHVKVTRRCCLSRIKVFSDFEAAPEHQSLPFSAHSNT